MTSENNNVNTKKVADSLLSLNLVWTIVVDGSVNLCIRKFESFKTAQELVRGSSNRLVANMYWMAAFKVLVFDASLFEETPKRSSSEIWKSLLSWIFSEGWPRVAPFHLNNLDKEVGNE